MWLAFYAQNLRSISMADSLQFMHLRYSSSLEKVSFDIAGNMDPHVMLEALEGCRASDVHLRFATHWDPETDDDGNEDHDNLYAASYWEGDDPFIALANVNVLLKFRNLNSLELHSSSLRLEEYAVWSVLATLPNFKHIKIDSSACSKSCNALFTSPRPASLLS